MQIDAHHHLWNYNPDRDSWITEKMHVIRRDFTPADFELELKKNNMDGSVVIQADSSETETDFLLKTATQNDFIKGVVGWIDLTSNNIEKRLQYYKKAAPKLKGFRHIVQAEADDFLLREDFCRGISLLKKYDYTYDILIYYKQLPSTLQFIKKFPHQKFVIDHIAKPDIKNAVMEPWKTQIKEIATHPNIYCKLSGIITEADLINWKEEDLKPYLDAVFEAFGTGRLLFGSDWPVCLLAGSYARVKQIILNYMNRFKEKDIEAVMGKNAIQFYNL